MTPEETMLREQLEESNAENVRLRGKVAELESSLTSYEASDTLPPNGDDTGDNTLAKMVAQLSMRVDNLEERESSRAGALQEIDRKMDIVLRRFEEYPAIDPADIRAIKEVVLSLPCAACGTEARRKLSLVPDSE